MQEYRKRSIVKAFCWRALATFSTMAIIYIFTGKAALSIQIGAVEVVVKMLIYYGHERLWNVIQWGRPTHPLASLCVNKELEPEHMEEIRKRLEELGYM